MAGQERLIMLIDHITAATSFLDSDGETDIVDGCLGRSVQEAVVFLGYLLGCFGSGYIASLLFVRTGGDSCLSRGQGSLQVMLQMVQNRYRWYM